MQIQLWYLFWYQTNHFRQFLCFICMYLHYTPFFSEFSCNSYYVIWRLCFHNIWYGHQQASFFISHPVVMVIMSSKDYILTSEKFKFPFLDLESPANLGLDASWTIQIGEGHSTCSWCPHHHFWYSMSHRPNQAFCLQIHDPLEKWVQEQVELSKLEEVKFSHQVSMSISRFTA